MPKFVKTTQRTYTYHAAASMPSARARDSQAARGADSAATRRRHAGLVGGHAIEGRLLLSCRRARGLRRLSGECTFPPRVARHPDQMVRNEQEDETLEARIILPVVRAVFRNVAENMTAFEFVARRSEIERDATDRITAELARYKVTCDGVYVGNIHLDMTEPGRKLLVTQTDREVAVNQRKFFGQ